MISSNMSPENSIEAWYKEIGKDEHEEMVKDMERGMEDIDKRVFNAFREVPRHKYVDPEEQRKAYDPILVLVHDKKEYDRAVKLRQDEWRIGELEETPDKEEMAYIDGYIKQKQMAKTSTASQPSLVATMLDSVLPPDELSQQKAVEIGAGTGYVVALLAKLFSNVVGAEIKP